MCLSVPMQVLEIDGHRARCTAFEQERWADLTLMGDKPPNVGEYVMIQLGFVQRLVPEADALESQALFQEIIDKLDEAEDRD